MPLYIGPFGIKKRVSPIAYELELAETLSRVYNMFHISELRKYISDRYTYSP